MNWKPLESLIKAEEKISQKMNPPIDPESFGENALLFVWPMLWQSSVLIAVLFAIDFALRRRVRAAVRYALWLVLLVKLLLAAFAGVAHQCRLVAVSPPPHPASCQTARFVVSLWL